MPARPIDTATVLIVPDVRGFVPALTRDLGVAFAAAGHQVDHASAQVGESFQRAGAAVGASMSEASASAGRSLTHIGVEAQASGADVIHAFDRAAVSAGVAMGGLSTTVDREMSHIDRSAAQAAAATQRHFSLASLGIGAALFGVTAAAGAGLVSITTMGLKSAAQLEQVQIGFNALLGSVDKGKQVFQQLQNFAAVTPFEFPDIADAAKRFLAFSASVGMTRDQLLDYLTTIGNVISVTGGGAVAFGRISLAIGQIGGASKVTLDNLNQIADAIPGFSPIQAIATSLGITTAEAMKRISSGSLPAAQGVQALLAGMAKFPGAAGAMEKQSQTLLGVFSTFKDTMRMTLTAAFQPAIPAIKQALNDVTPIIGDALGKIAPLLGQTLSMLLPLVGSLIKAIVPILQPILDALGPAIAALAPALEPLGQALGQLIVPLTPLLPVIGQLALILAVILTPALKVLALVLTPLKPLLEFVGRAVGEFATFLQQVNWRQVGDDIGHGFTVAWRAVSAFFVGAARWFALLPFRILHFVEGLPDILGRMFSRALDRTIILIGMGIGLILTSFSQLPHMIFNYLLRLDVEGTRIVGQFMLHLVEASWNGIMYLVRLFVRLPFMIVDALTGLGPLLLHLIGDAFDTAKDRAIKSLTAIITFVLGLPHRLIGLAAEVGGSIVSFMIRALNGVVDRLNEGIARVDDVIPGDLPRIPHLAHGGIAMGPALIGETGAAVPEAAIPLGDPAAMRMLQRALGGGGPTINVAPGGIVVNVNGGTMTPDQAHQAGEQIAVGMGAGIRTAVRAA